MPSRDLKVTILGVDDSGGAFNSAGRNADGFGNKMSGLGKSVALAFGGAAVAGIAGLGASLVQGVKDAASYQQITDQLAQTIKSTGGAAGVSVEGLKAYAGQLESISGVDEELILSSQNVLATFTNIRNGVGEGNDIFNQASEAALNLSTTMGGDLQGASVLVGKALQDPIKGVTALGRAGVMLTQSQKDTIKAMVAAGDAAGAQKIILGELETQFGGAAAAAGQGLTGSIARLKDGFQDAFRTLAENLLPAITAFVTGAAAALPGIIDRIKAGFDAARPSLEAIGAVLLTVGGFIRDNLMPILGAVGAALGAIALSGAVAFISGLVASFTAVAAASGGFAAVLALIGGPITLVVAGVAALAAGLVYAYQHVESFRTAVQAVAAFITGTVIPALAQLAEWLRGRLSETIAYVIKLWPQVSAAVDQAMKAVSAVVGTVLAAVQGLWRTFGGTLTSFVTGTFENLKTIISGALNIIKGVVQTVLAVINGDWSRAWDGLKTVASGALQVLSGIVSQGMNVIKSVFSAAWSAFAAVVSAAWAGISSAVSAGIGAAVSLVSGLPGRITSALGNLGSLLSGAGRELIAGLIGGITEKLGALREKMSSVASTIKGFLPGSPVKTGPLTSWNNGGAGKRLMGLLAEGIDAEAPTVRRSMQAATDLADLAGMRLGGGAFVSSRLASTSAAAPTERAAASATGDPHLAELRALRGSVDELKAAMAGLPAQYRMADRKGPQGRAR